MFLLLFICRSNIGRKGLVAEADDRRTCSFTSSAAVAGAVVVIATQWAILDLGPGTWGGTRAVNTCSFFKQRWIHIGDAISKRHTHATHVVHLLKAERPGVRIVTHALETHETVTPALFTP